MLDPTKFDGSVTYALDRADSDAVRAAVNGIYGNQARSMLPFGFVFIVLGIAIIVSSITGRHRSSTWPFSINGVLQIVTGVVYVIQATKPRFFIVRRPRVGVLSTLAWNSRGFSFGLAGGTEKMTLWAAVSRLEVSGSVLQLHRKWKPAIVVPRRAFFDEGDGFIAYVEDRIIGKRLLVRPSPGVPYRPITLSGKARR